MIEYKETEVTARQVANKVESTMHCLANHSQEVAQNALGKMGSLKLRLKTRNGASTTQQPCRQREDIMKYLVKKGK